MLILQESATLRNLGTGFKRYTTNSVKSSVGYAGYGS